MYSHAAWIDLYDWACEYIEQDKKEEANGKHIESMEEDGIQTALY